MTLNLRQLSQRSGLNIFFQPTHPPRHRLLQNTGQPSAPTQNLGSHPVLACELPEQAEHIAGIHCKIHTSKTLGAHSCSQEHKPFPYRGTEHRGTNSWRVIVQQTLPESGPQRGTVHISKWGCFKIFPQRFRRGGTDIGLNMDVPPSCKGFLKQIKIWLGFRKIIKIWYGFLKKIKVWKGFPKNIRL